MTSHVTGLEGLQTQSHHIHHEQEGTGYLKANYTQIKQSCKLYTHRHQHQGSLLTPITGNQI